MDDKGHLGTEMFNCRLEELNVIDMAFLAGCSVPTVALLYEDAKHARHIKTYAISMRSKVGAARCWGRAGSAWGSGHFLGLDSQKPLYELAMQVPPQNPGCFLLRCLICSNLHHLSSPLLNPAHCLPPPHCLTPHQDLEEGPLAHQNLDAGASMIIPVPAPLGGAIVVGESVVTYFSTTSPQYQRSAALKQTIVRVSGKDGGGGARGVRDCGLAEPGS